jgi:iron complex outermembrane receptor protein
MKTSVTRQRHSTRSRPALALSPLAAAISALLLPVGAFAQQQTSASIDPNSTLEDVVVTGIRHAIEASVTIKRESDSIVEAISSEDLGKLPDLSIADALARLPGLTSQRVDGRSEVISIRGLAPKYSVTLLNGRELVSTGDNRSVEFDQFPAELINAVTVYKTPDAALGAQGLSGTVNLQTLKPLDSPGRQVNFNARAERNSNGQLVSKSSDEGGRISFSYVDKFFDDKVGIAFGFAHLDSPGQEKATKAWWWGNSSIWGGGFRGLEHPNPADTPSTLQGFESTATSTSHVRDGIMAVVEFKPNANYHGELDLYYSKFAQTAQGREFQAGLMPDWSGDGSAVPGPGQNPCQHGETDPTMPGYDPTNSPNGTVCGGPIYSNVTTAPVGQMQYANSGTITNLDPYVLSRYDRRKDRIKAVGFNNEFFLGEWTATADLSYSKANRDEVVAEAYMSAPTMTGVNFNIPLGFGFLQYAPTLDYSNPNNLRMRGIGGWGTYGGLAQAGAWSPLTVDDEMKGLRLDVKRGLDWGILSSIDAGVNLTERKKSYDFEEFAFVMPSGTQCVDPSSNCAPIPAGLLQPPANLGFAGIGGLPSFSIPDAMATGIYQTAQYPDSLMPGRIWAIDEKITTAYGKLGLRFHAGVPVHGNIGVQVVHANQQSSGVVWTTQLDPYTLGKSYTDVLPSLNLVFDVAPQTYLRVSAAKVLARPNLDDMRAGFTASISSSTSNPPGRWSGSGGNPLLEPWRAKQFDVSLEHYIGKRSYVSIAAFRKNVDTTVFNQDLAWDFTGMPNPTHQSVDPAFGNIGTMSAPANGKGGHIQGVEYSLSYEFGRLIHALDGFGTQASVSKTTSSIPGYKIGQQNQIDISRPVEGLSGTVQSIVLYYEKSGFEFRIAQRYRSDFDAAVRGVWIAQSMSSVKGERVTDLQASYTFQDGGLKGLTLLVEANNLSDEPYRTSSNDDSYTQLFTPSGGAQVYNLMPERYQRFGRQYLVGINYKF